MKKLLPLATLLCWGCASASPWIPLQADSGPSPAVVLVWAGQGACERLEEGHWVRRPTFDYSFTVEQRRFGDHWESVKTMRRLHPDYDGSAGPRTQVFFFRLDLAEPDAQGTVALALKSSLGDGGGSTDREFRSAELNFLAAGVSGWAPFDRYRIRQDYRYEAGELREMVELNKGQEPWVRNSEQATLFAPQRFQTPPTLR
ncbi:MAG: hypothetical protein U1E65_10115 [Myxococcota bacterium]